MWPTPQKKDMADLSRWFLNHTWIESLGSKFPHLKSSCMAFLLRVSGEDVAVVIGQWQGAHALSGMEVMLHPWSFNGYG